ncbi:MAG: sulfate permease [Deltaproteobacteria bacterium]|jgi:sulfate permease, SulP family|nr:sulfate permease [Deltaproteobacteria bacterium]MBT4526681.1 sulfate permease [Deltaproteobacteria bacterium]
MKIASYQFNRLEFSGSLGDLGTLIPLSLALIIICQLSATTVFLMIGIFYLSCGFFYKLPIPVQPLKVVSAIAIAFPAKITLPVLAASGLTFGVILLLLSLTGLINWIAKFFSKPIVRGIQLGLGLILISKGIGFVLKPELLIEQTGVINSFWGISANLLLGIIGGIVTLILISNKRFPAALIIVIGGLMVGLFTRSLSVMDFNFGPTPIQLYIPSFNDFSIALIFLVIPQVPLTLGNAVIGTVDTCQSLFKKEEATKKVTNINLSLSMGIINIITGFLGGMPMCHGAGGLAAHYRFGARTGGSNLMIGTVFLVIALGFGSIGLVLFSSIPNAVLGILLLFAGLELAVLIRDIKEKNDLFITILIAGIGFVTTNMGIAFFIGIIVTHLIKWKKVVL